MISKKRNFGLDIIRASAIIMVLMAHAAPVFDSNSLVYYFFYDAGLYGVEFFFVLSGYLIGQILFKNLIYNLSFQEIKVFYLRRWLRTLPLYYVVLSILVIIDIMSKPGHNPHILHFLFLQNFHPVEAGFFGVSWSLSIEEWFYLTLPILFYIFLKKTKIHNVTSILITTISGIIFLRLLYVLVFNPTFDLGVRKFIPLRFDSLLIGVLIANVKIKFGSLYKKLYNIRFAVISVVLLCIYYLWFVYTMMISETAYLDASTIVRVFSWPIISILMGSIMIYFENSNFINKRLKKISLSYLFFTYMSLYSYSIYLIHFDIYYYFHKYLFFNNLLLDLIIPTFFIFITAMFIYKYFERPILDKRNIVFVHSSIKNTHSHKKI